MTKSFKLDTSTVNKTSQLPPACILQVLHTAQACKYLTIYLNTNYLNN